MAIGSDSLVTLFHSYNVHFSKYLAGKKKFLQKVPAIVWKHLYKYYLNYMRLKAEAATETFDEAKLPGERTLQDGLSAAFNDIGTGVSDDTAAK